MAYRLPQLRPAGMSDDEDDDNDDADGMVMTSGPNPEAHLPDINNWFLCNSMLPFANYQDVPRRGGCWLELFYTFNQDFKCRFDKFATSCIITPMGLEMGPHSILAFNHFSQGIERQHARGETVSLGRWLYYFQIHLGIYNYNFLIKVRQLVSQHCVDNRIWLRWRSDLSDY